jgi:membrane protein DedA with SNARE-associated domain
MEQLGLLLERFGYPLLFGVGFLEFAGAPIASVPILVIAGALAASGDVSVAGIVISAALGGLVGDLLWFGLARWRGQGLVDLVCGLSSNPMACVIGVERRVQAVGPRYLAPAKFIPGAGNLVAAASGFTNMRLRTFLLFDLVGLSIWSAVYTILGWIFAAQVGSVIEWASAFTLWIVAMVSGLIGAAAAWRVAKVWMHKRHHDAMRTRAAAGPDVSDGALVQPVRISRPG